MMRAAIVVSMLIGCACGGDRAAAPAGPGGGTARAGAALEIPPAPDQPVTALEKSGQPFTGDLDAIAGRGHLRILVAPSRIHFETIDRVHRGRAVDAGVALAAYLAEQVKQPVTPVFIETRDDQLIPSLLAGRGDVAANVLQTIERDEQVAFAPPIKTGIRELVVTDATALVSLEDVGGLRIHVRRNGDHHASLTRLNVQLQRNNRRRADILFDEKAKTEEDLLDSVNAGRIRATIVYDYIFDRWQGDMLKVAKTNREIAVSQDGVLAWVTRKDAPQLIALLKEFFSTRKLTL